MAQDRWSQLLSEYAVARIAPLLVSPVPIDDAVALDALIVALRAQL